MIDNLIKFGVGVILGWIFGWIVAIFILVALVWTAVVWGDKPARFAERDQANEKAYHDSEKQTAAQGLGWHRTSSGIPYKIEGEWIYNGNLQIVGHYPEDFGPGKSLDPTR